MLRAAPLAAELEGCFLEEEEEEADGVLPEVVEAAELVEDGWGWWGEDDEGNVGWDCVPNSIWRMTFFFFFFLFVDFLGAAWCWGVCWDAVDCGVDCVVTLSVSGLLNLGDFIMVIVSFGDTFSVGMLLIF